MDMARIEDALREVRGVDKVKSATLVSRSGMHIAGEVPKGAHLETFVAMSAIMVGAAETATSELKESLGYISITLSEGNLMLRAISNKALLVMKVENGFDMDKAKAELEKTFSDLDELL